MVQELFNRARTCLHEHLPFVLYKKPNSNELVGVFQHNDEVYRVDDFEETGFIFAPFDSDADAVYIRMDSVLREALFLDKSNYNAELNILSKDVGEKENYISLVQKALAQIKKGAFNKVVVSRKIQVEITDSHLDIFHRLLATYEEAFCYYLYHPNIGTWMGATPEILIKSSGNQFTTMSLAGTQKVQGDDPPQWTLKELNEQQLVTDYIVDVLDKNAETLQILDKESIKAGQLWHLRTELKGVMLPSKFGDILQALHPTPAVCGNPLQDAKSFILNNEYYQRSFYTGFLGELNIKAEQPRNRNRKNQENSAYRSVKKISELYVNLRCMQLLNNEAILYVGGGITEDSDPEKEWEETAIKSKTMLRVLNSK
ncbi:chorismate-binding protein [Maribacter sp. LLG6340-A2]|uniref:chorismate-binding protein n=1 Tax=Maribacter sp. LLG6340-A2 TaxID=3160834 RepID=UPI00386567EF